MKAKKAKRTRGVRLSDTLKNVSSPRSILHLFGPSLQHAIDACFSHARQDKDRRKRALQELPLFLRPTAEKVLDDCLLYEAELREAQKLVLSSSGHDIEARESTAIIGVDDLPHLRTERKSSPLVANLINDGAAGLRRWKICDQAHWLDFLRREMSERSHYRTNDRHRGKAKNKGELLDFYFRAPPWLAEVVGTKLERVGVEAETSPFWLFLKEFAEEFAGEAGVDVVGMAIHRERRNDLHVHLICSEARETATQQKHTTREFKALVSGETKRRIAMRKADKHNVLPVGRNKVRAEVEAEMKTQLKTVVKYVRTKRRRPWRILGPAFRGKVELYLASGLDPRVAKLGDDRPESPRSFRALVGGKNCAELEKSLKETYLDFWGTKCLCSKLGNFVGNSERAQIEELKQRAVKDYIELGTSQPSLEDFMARKLHSISQSIEPLNREKLEEYEQIVAELEDVSKECAKAQNLDRIKSLKRLATKFLMVRKAFWQLRDVLPTLLKTLAGESRRVFARALEVLGFDVPAQPEKKQSKDALPQKEL